MIVTIIVIVFLAFILLIGREKRPSNMISRAKRHIEIIKAIMNKPIYSNPDLNLYENIETTCNGAFAYECTSAYCDCSQLCGNNNFLRRFVHQGERILFKNHLLQEGHTYCLPSGHDIRSFERWKYMPVFTGSKWEFQDINIYYSNDPCKSSILEDKENALNNLWDFKENIIVSDLNTVDLEEILQDVQLPRYRCKCMGKDRQSNLLVSVPYFPSLCLPDPCKRYTPSVDFKGLDVITGECDCGLNHNNIFPGDKNTICSLFPYRFDPKTGEFNLPVHCWSDPKTTPLTDLLTKYPCPQEPKNVVNTKATLFINEVGSIDNKKNKGGSFYRNIEKLSKTIFGEFARDNKLFQYPKIEKKDLAF